MPGDTDKIHINVNKMPGDTDKIHLNVNKIYTNTDKTTYDDTDKIQLNINKISSDTSVIITPDHIDEEDDDTDEEDCIFYYSIRLVGFLLFTPIIIIFIFCVMYVCGEIKRPAPVWHCNCSPVVNLQKILVNDTNVMYCCPSYNLTNLCVNAVYSVNHYGVFNSVYIVFGWIGVVELLFIDTMYLYACCLHKKLTTITNIAIYLLGLIILIGVTLFINIVFWPSMNNIDIDKC